MTPDTHKPDPRLFPKYLREVSDPVPSFWIEANAGAGKTTVLTTRILRLLLSGCAPERLLCLTYTRAGAAEMENRVREKLAHLAALPDNALIRELEEMNGTKPDEALLARARTLFVLVLDSPMLCIQTIHSFCQSILARFPLEAGLAPHLSVLSEADANALLAQAYEATLADALDPERAKKTGETTAENAQELGEKLEILVRETSEGQLESAIRSLAGQPAHMQAFHAAHQGNRNLRRQWISTAQGPDDDFSQDDPAQTDIEKPQPSDVADAAIHHLDLLRKIAENLAGDHRNTYKTRGQIMRAWLAGGEKFRIGDWENWRTAFLTQAGSPIKHLLPREQRADDLEKAMRLEGERIVSVEERIRVRRVTRLTEALLTIAESILARYTETKEVRGLVDYADLIHHTRALLESKGGVGWTQYKLDGAIDHILVDEAQDTSPEQWAILRALSTEFRSGQGAGNIERADRAEERGRTLFVVGDNKQSIYGFQGASPEEYQKIRDEEDRAWRDAKLPWQHAALQVSYRSAHAILALVDRVFAGGDLLEGTPTHHVADRKAVGQVELWPPFLPGKAEEPRDPWKPPPQKPGEDAPEEHLARAIAGRIRFLLEKGTSERQGSAIHPSDIMILVRRRNPLMVPIVRALKRADIPVAGLDRQILTDEIAVQDLCALTETLLLPEDDLGLALTLRSPLFDVSEEDLFELATGRGKKRYNLWQNLLFHRHAASALGEAARFLVRLRSRTDYLTPFDLFAHILGPEGGRRRLIARLGHEAEEPIDELLSLALQFEHLNPPSLTGFLRWLHDGAVEIKRQLTKSERNEVRVITIHGAKGLEAPIVILPDTAPLFPARNEAPIWLAREGAPPVPLWAPREELRNAHARGIHAQRQEREESEKRRLLYVAMTRARDHLILCGLGATPKAAQQKRKASDWRNSFETALGQMPGVRRTLAGKFAQTHFAEPPPWEEGEAILLGKPPKAPKKVEVPAKLRPPLVPVWLYEPVERATPAPQAGPAAETARPAETPKQNAARRRGELVHVLLQYLPDFSPGQRQSIGRRWLDRMADDLSDAQKDEIVAACGKLFDDERFGPLFEQGGRAEVPIAGRINGNLIKGRIDRLRVYDDRVLIIDFKTGSAPSSIETTQGGYLRQLARYRALIMARWPDRPAHCVLLWVDAPVVQEIPSVILERIMENESPDHAIA